MTNICGSRSASERAGSRDFLEMNTSDKPPLVLIKFTQLDHRLINPDGGVFKILDYAPGAQSYAWDGRKTHIILMFLFFYVLSRQL